MFDEIAARHTYGSALSLGASPRRASNRPRIALNGTADVWEAPPPPRAGPQRDGTTRADSLTFAQDSERGARYIVVIIAVGVAVGWLSTAVHGTGFGLISDMAIGIVGALIGDWLLLRLNVGLGEGIVPLLINAAIGAIILVLIIKFASGGTGWRGGLR